VLILPISRLNLLQNLVNTNQIRYFATNLRDIVMKETAGNNLRILREKFHYTHEDIAKYLGIERGAYANYDCGSREMPYELMLKICELYGLSLADLFEEDAAKLDDGLICCFRTDSLDEQDQKEIFRFKNVIRNYLKLVNV
jgi:transcriptional regulator with XRE-family HTH domain